MGNEMIERPSQELITPSKDCRKKDHAGMKKAAQIVKGGAVVLGLVVSVIPGLKGLSNLVKKS